MVSNMTANEIEFLSEDEEVKIIPKFAMNAINMIGVSSPTET